MQIVFKSLSMTVLGLALMLGTAALPNKAKAAICEGNVTNYTVDNTGFLIVGVQGADFQVVFGRFCNLDQVVSGTVNYNGISKTMCQAIYSSVTAAYLSQRLIRFYTGNSTACSAISPPPSGYRMVTGFHTWELR